MKKMIIVSTMLLLFVFTGCSSVNKSFNAAPFSVSASASLEADVEVGGKISGTARGTYLFGLICLGGPTKFADNTGLGGFGPSGLLKSAAAYNAMEDSGADVIVNPQYVIEANKNIFIHSYKVTITGYKGTIRSIK